MHPEFDTVRWQSQMSCIHTATSCHAYAIDTGHHPRCRVEKCCSYQAVTSRHKADAAELNVEAHNKAGVIAIDTVT